MKEIFSFLIYIFILIISFFLNKSIFKNKNIHNFVNLIIYLLSLLTFSNYIDSFNDYKDYEKIQVKVNSYNYRTNPQTYTQHNNIASTDIRTTTLDIEADIDQPIIVNYAQHSVIINFTYNKKINGKIVSMTDSVIKESHGHNSKKNQQEISTYVNNFSKNHNNLILYRNKNNNQFRTDKPKSYKLIIFISLFLISICIYFAYKHFIYCGKNPKKLQCLPVSHIYEHISLPSRVVYR